jgi:hypothetical protein
MKFAVLLGFTAALVACDDPKGPASARTRGMPDTCCVGGPEAPDRTQVVSRTYLKAGPQRTFGARIAGRAGPFPAGTKRLRLWFPVPQDSTVQTIRTLAYSHPPQLGLEPKYGNRMAFWEIEAPTEPVERWLTFEVTRTEIQTDLARLQPEGRDDASAFEVFRAADRGAVLNSDVGRVSDQACQGKLTAVGKARAIYDYVTSSMALDPSPEGSGRGSTAYALEHHRGDAEDLHALFNSLARSQGIASGVEVGLTESASETLGSWAFFRAPGKTWVPVTCAEAKLHPDRKEYFFGSLPADRVTLSTGRDLSLVPEQEGGPLRTFGAPYGEADGKPVPVVLSWSFKPIE